MLNIEAHEVPFSFEQPDSVLSPLVAILQQALNDPRTRALRGKIFLSAYYVVIIDTHEERAQYIAQALNAMGYQSLIAATALDAFRLFLQGKVVPFALILGHEDSSSRLFLHRLVQQVTQRAGWDLLLIRLLPKSSPQHRQSSTELAQQSPSQRMQTAPLRQISTGKLPGEQPSPQTPLPFIQQTSGAMHALQMPRTPPQTSPLASASASRLPARGEAADRRGVSRPQAEKVSLENHDMGRYHIETLMGSGAYGSVYRAYDRLREQNIALKAIQTDSIPYHMMDGALEEAHFFQLEEELLGKIGHPHILPLMHSGKSYISGTPFIYKTMPLYNEGSLAQWLQGHNVKTYLPQDVVYLVVQIADTLQHIHNQNATHQNFKPTNLLLRSESEDIRHLYLLLADFAIPQDGSFFSDSPSAFPYMAPERWQGQAHPASDQYALAAFTYELLAGRPPFHGNTESIMRHLHQNMQPQLPSMHNPSLPSFVDKVLMRALAKRPEERFSSISIFARTFQRYC